MTTLLLWILSTDSNGMSWVNIPQLYLQRIKHTKENTESCLVNPIKECDEDERNDDSCLSKHFLAHTNKIVNSMNDVCVNVAEEIASDSFVNPQYDPNQLEMVELTDLPEISSFGDHINQEGLKYIAGYVAHRFRDKYSNVGSTTGNVTGKRPDWLSCISKGNLLCPSEELLQATVILNKEFEEILGNFIAEGKLIFDSLAEQASQNNYHPT